MKSDLEMTNEILRQLHLRKAAQKKQRTVIGAAVGALAVAVTAVGIVYRAAAQKQQEIPVASGALYGAGSGIGAGGTEETATEPATKAATDAAPDGALPGDAQTEIYREDPPGNGSETTADASRPEPVTGALQTTTTTPQAGFETTVGVTSGAIPPSTAVQTTADPPAPQTERSTAAQTPSPRETTAHLILTTTRNLTTAPPETTVPDGGTTDRASGEGRSGDSAKTTENTIRRTGEKLTDARARAYFRENRAWLENSLIASGVSAEGLRISDKGYCHVNCDGEGGAPELRQNFRDYLAYSGDRLVAIITLVLENDRIYGTPAFGAPWFDSFNDLLQSHKGEALVFVYYGSTEMILFPDGTARTTLPEASVSAAVDYERFYCPEAVYVP